MNKRKILSLVVVLLICALFATWMVTHNDKPTTDWHAEIQKDDIQDQMLKRMADHKIECIGKDVLYNFENQSNAFISLIYYMNEWTDTIDKDVLNITIEKYVIKDNQNNWYMVCKALNVKVIDYLNKR